MVIALILLPVMSLITGYFTFKGVQLGLRWQIQVQAKELPTLNNPVTEAIEQKQQEKAAKEQQSLYDEWTKGGDKK
jgi:uncharacterized membrane protein